jgi:hypothetical protein
MPSTNPQDAIAAAREVLPAWVIWGNDVLFAMTFLSLAVTGTWLATRFALIPLRRAAPETWVERARVAFVGRMAVSIAGVVFPIATITWGAMAQTHLSQVPRLWLAVSTALVTIVLMIAARCRVKKQLGSDSINVAEGLRSAAACMLILVPRLSIAVVVLPLMPDQFNETAAILLGGMIVLSLMLTAGDCSRSRSCR